MKNSSERIISARTVSSASSSLVVVAFGALAALGAAGGAAGGAATGRGSAIDGAVAACAAQAERNAAPRSDCATNVRTETSTWRGFMRADILRMRGAGSTRARYGTCTAARQLRVRDRRYFIVDASTRSSIGASAAELSARARSSRFAWHHSQWISSTWKRKYDA